METKYTNPKKIIGKLKVVEFQLCEPTETYISSPENIFNLVKDDFSSLSEELYVLVMNVKNQVLKILISKGTHNSLITTPADVLRPVLMTNGIHYAICHNHPSGDIKPSSEDLQFTRKIKKASEVLGVSLLDHLIYSDKEYYSFKQEGLL